MLFIDTKLTLTQFEGEIRIANDSDYNNSLRTDVATYYFLYRINQDGSKTEIILQNYDPYATDFITYIPSEPGLYEVTIFITEDCQDTDRILVYSDDIIIDEKEDFLKCKPLDCGCLECDDEPFQKLDTYIRLKTLLEAVKDLEAMGEIATAACILHNILKIQNYEKNCKGC